MNNLTISKDDHYAMCGPTDIGDLFENPEDFETFKDRVLEKNPSNYIRGFTVGSPDFGYICTVNYNPNTISFIIKIPKSNMLSFFDASANPLRFSAIREHGGLITEICGRPTEVNNFKRSFNGFTDGQNGYFEPFKTKLEEVIGTSDVWTSPLRYGGYWEQQRYFGHGLRSWTFNGYTVSSYSNWFNIIIVYGNSLAGIFRQYSNRPHMLVKCNYYMSNNAHSRGYNPELPRGRLLYKAIGSMEMVMPGAYMPIGFREIFRDRLQHFDLTCPNDDFMYFLGWVTVE